MNYIPPNSARVFVGLASLISMTAGAWMLWGFGAALFISGLFLAIDTSLDEITERATKTTRFKTDAAPADGGGK